MTEPVAENLAVELALVRLLDKLQSELATDLATVKPADLKLPAPTAQDYHLGISRPQIERVTTNSDVAIFVWQPQPSSFLDSESATPGAYTARQLTYAQILVAYKARPQETYTLFQKDQGAHDIMARRGYRYLAAITSVIRSHLKGGAGIIHLEKFSDFAGAVRLTADGDPMIGYASALWGFHQAVTVTVDCDAT